MNNPTQAARTMLGLPVIESDLIQPVPRMTLSENVPVTPQFRSEINAWMRDFFGMKDVAYVMTDPFTGQQTIAMHPKHAALLKLESSRYI